MYPSLKATLAASRIGYSSSSVLVHHSKLNIVVQVHACGNKLNVVIIMLICIGPYLLINLKDNIFEPAVGSGPNLARMCP